MQDTQPQQLQQQTHNSSTTAVTEDIAVKIAKKCPTSSF